MKNFKFPESEAENIILRIVTKLKQNNGILLITTSRRTSKKVISKIRKEEAKEIRKIKTKTLNSIIENSKFKNEKINLISIDVEGHEIEVFESLKNFNKDF